MTNGIVELEEQLKEKKKKKKRRRGIIPSPANRRIFHLVCPVVSFPPARLVLETASGGRSIRRSCRVSFEREEEGGMGRTKRKKGVDLNQRGRLVSFICRHVTSSTF